MHLLAAQAGSVSDGTEAVDLGQDPGDIVILSAADTELAALSAAQAAISADHDGAPSLRLANLLRLGHHMSVDLYVEAVVEHARLVVVRLLGGRSYWPYGIEQVFEACRRHAIPLAVVPGDDQPDADLTALCTIAPEAAHRLWQYFVHGGPDNAANALAYCAHLLGRETRWAEPVPLLQAGPWWPDRGACGLEAVQARWQDDAPVAAVVFYRALMLSGDLAPVQALVEGLAAHGLNPLPLYCTSLKDPVAGAVVGELLAAAPPDIIVTTTGFSVSAPGGAPAASPLDGTDCPIVQAVLSGSDEDAWRDGTHGLAARDIAMNVALPEVDGRILSRAVSFKAHAERDPLTQADIVRHRPLADRVEFVCRLAAAWARLRRTPPACRRIALVLANYPNRDARLGNGVGLDTPAATVAVLHALKAAGYRVEDIPADGNALVERLQSGPTNDWKRLGERTVSQSLSMADYHLALGEMDPEARAALTARWGAPEDDPFHLPGALDCGRFAIPAFRCGDVAVCLQPARGYNVDPAQSYHDPALVPPHAYIAFHAWLRHGFGAHAVVHMGKHGNLEWLPGKALALSRSCWPEVALGPLPNLYPFIVNDPGEGSQAKRRTAAVVVDHLTPPLTRAESYGPLRDLELLVDEFFEAAGTDPRRLDVLRREILAVARASGLDADCAITVEDDDEAALAKLDAHLCDLKEMQIRDGLHVFGRSPEGRLATDLLVALARVPRGSGEGGDASLHRALASDLGLGFDPLDCAPAEAWSGPRPDVLAGLSSDTWRTAGDTVERIELLAAALVAGERTADPAWTCTAAVLATIETALRPAVAACGRAEMAGLLTGLDGRFVAPGPSGAPTRGRPDVLPTGRNFYSVDTRVVPTPAAWHLGWKSACLLVERYVQDHGEWPRTMAVSAWGTANMRTGGDDIAQALALMGVRPTWDTVSRRVTGFEILPASVLGRPRVDVTLRISGFFRDAFPALVDLVDSAVQAVAAIADESAEDNPLAAAARAEAGGDSSAAAMRRATYRVFGSRPGAYGAGLQALIDEKGWDSDADLARAYVAWGGYAYGAGEGGTAAHGLFERRLSGVQAVVHNQDNREHDLLDSDDYYQFEGGLTAAVRTLSGRQPGTYHMDHVRPESPRARTLDEEIARVVRARAANPKWIAGAMRHGYKGGFEMAATVDYLFAFAATARCVADHHFDTLFDAYLGDETVRDFLAANNPEALKDMAARFEEASERGLWRPRRNDVGGVLAAAAARRRGA